jgi:hypothetical protein
MAKDGHKEEQAKYDRKSRPYSDLEKDAGGLGKNRTDYETKKKSRGGQGPFGSQDENAARYHKKASDKYNHGGD